MVCAVVTEYLPPFPCPTFTHSVHLQTMFLNNPCQCSFGHVLFFPPNATENKQLHVCFMKHQSWVTPFTSSELLQLQTVLRCAGTKLLGADPNHCGLGHCHVSPRTPPIVSCCTKNFLQWFVSCTCHRTNCHASRLLFHSLAQHLTLC